MEDIKIGDIVKLKSGSPLMTVGTIENFTTYKIANCIWFYKSSINPVEWLGPYEGKFYVSQLVKSLKE